MTLKPGDSGSEVEQLQLKLKAAGYDPGEIDGSYGPKTTAAVLAFQLDRPDIDDDGLAGPQTMGSLNAAILRITASPPIPPIPSGIVPCNDETWKLVETLVAAITTYPVRYGPGRGLWDKDKFVITYGAGRLGGTVQQWPNVLGKTYPAFHCTSWCNFFISWLCRRNQDYTHAGNIPEIWELLLSTPDVHQNPGAGPYRGFGDVCYQLAHDGSAVKRHGIPKIMDARELYDRRADLPTFMMFGQSTKRSTGWNWWHHTGVYMARDGKLYRIAADGSKGSNGYSASPMKFTEITEKNLSSYGNAIYRVYGVKTTDGTYGDKSRSYAPVSFER
jgi:peptidoglycan hydrolase-like protein with peptidoglycan-binding domain